MADLFDLAPPIGPRPLADLLRPERIEDIVGQSHLFADPDSMLNRCVKARQIGSLILYGPPGTGKTTIARAIGKTCGKEFHALHGSDDGVKSVQKLVEIAKTKPVLAFIDEIHRFNRTQSDALLKLAEEGILDLICATTENPYVLSGALMSRSTVVKLHEITTDDLQPLLERGMAHYRAMGLNLQFGEKQRRDLAGRANGDARRMLCALEKIAIGRQGEILVTDAMVDEVYQGVPLNYDRSGDQHYDHISPMIKSMRGGDPDAAIYWLQKMLTAGEDPVYISRRLMVHASEDVGLADNSALQTAVAAAHAVKLVGMPEAEIILAHATLHICLAPKSGSAYDAIKLAKDHIQRKPAIHVPLHLRDGHHKGAVALGHTGYVSPHSTEIGWHPQEYLPGVARGTFYRSHARGDSTFEARAVSYWERITGRAWPKLWPQRAKH